MKAFFLRLWSGFLRIWEWIVGAVIVVAVLIFVLFVWPVPQIRDANSAPVTATPAPAPAVETTAFVLSVPINAGCPTEREFFELVGVHADIVGGENCAFHWRGDPLTITVNRPCPSGWICTLGISSQNYVYEGDDALQPLQIFAGTWRLVSKYAAGDAVYDSCTFLAKVQEEGRENDPKWAAKPGNFSCNK